MLKIINQTVSQRPSSKEAFIFPTLNHPEGIKMKQLVIAIIAAILFSGCQSSNQLEPVSKIKPGVASEGTLANEKLVTDTIDGLNKILGKPAITQETKILKFVIQQPAGKVGSRAWREIWIVNLQNARTQFLITFRESGLGAADFEIQLTNNEPKQ